MTITKKYSTEELSFTMTLEQPTPGHVSIPIYANIPETSKPKGIVVMIPEQEFEDDMEILLPKRLGNDWGEACFMTYQELVIAHLKRYGRILPADLGRYVAEMVLVMCSIGDAVQAPIPISQRKNIFKQVLLTTSKELDLPIEIPL